MRISYWEKIKDARKKGMTAEEIERIEELESAIVSWQDRIEECEKEIKQIESKAAARLNGEGEIREAGEKK